MKRILLFCVLALLSSINIFKAAGQISVHVNISNPPVWAPPAEAHVIRYYYIPEKDTYYDAVRSGYYYNHNGRWTFANRLPSAYGTFDIGKLHHIAVRYYGNEPYTYFKDQRIIYVKKYRDDRRESGHSRPYHVPPGQAKKQRNWMPPGQAKKHGHNKKHGKD
ncbi:hypothetical protein [Mucilaginibacter sp.]|uniref:hypothetical protein n=1 Tax=Mucilaginibacter sp. TaxID=1882438 RepID=UPI0032641B01